MTANRSLAPGLPGVGSSLIKQLEFHGAMYVQPYRYDTVVAYLAGYDRAQSESGKDSKLDQFCDWLRRRLGHDFSMDWSAIVRDELSGGDEDIALRKLFELFHQFEDTRLNRGRLFTQMRCEATRHFLVFHCGRGRQEQRHDASIRLHKTLRGKPGRTTRGVFKMPRGATVVNLGP